MLYMYYILTHTDDGTIIYSRTYMCLDERLPNIYHCSDLQTFLHRGKMCSSQNIHGLTRSTHEPYYHEKLLKNLFLFFWSLLSFYAA